MRLAHKLWRSLPHGFRRSLFETVTLARAPRPAALKTKVEPEHQVIVAGVLRAPTGLGEAARGTIRALQSMGRDVRIVDLTDAFRQESVMAAPALAGPSPGPGTLLVFANPPMSSYALRFVPPPLLEGKLRIASWVWEYAKVPESWRRHVERYHRIATPTRLVADALNARTGVTSLHLPYHVHALPGSAEPRQASGRFRIGFIGDLVAAAGRKNPGAVIEAAGRAFAGRADVEIMMIMRGARADHPVVRTLKERAAQFGLALIIDDRVLDTPAHWARLRALDAFCSLHRCEGFGLNIAEAMAAGIPTVATCCPAVSDYLDETVGYPVRWDAVAAEPLIDDPTPGTWADPDIDAAAAALASIEKDRESAMIRARAAIARIDALYSASAVSAALDRAITDAMA